MGSDSNLALRPFLEQVERFCGGLDKNSLVKLVLRMAEEAAPEGRASYLDRLRSLSAPPPPPAVSGDFHEELQRLKDDIEHRIEALENGDYEELDDYDPDNHEYYDYGDDIPSVSEEQTDELEGFFQEADGLFVANQHAEAGERYAALFAFWDELRAKHGPVEEPAVNWREARARHCRCVYETAPAPERPLLLLAAMNPAAPLDEHGFDLFTNKLPLFADVVDAAPGELPGLKDFLPAWRQLLERGSSPRARSLALEAVHLTEGLPALGPRLSQVPQPDPRGHLYLMHFQELSGAWDELAKTAQAALALFPGSKLRAAVAGKLAEAGKRLGGRTLALEGWQELLRSAPTNRSLEGWLDAAGDAWAEELPKALASLSGEGGGDAMRVKLQLMAGGAGPFLENPPSLKPSVWAYGNTPGQVVFAGVAAALACPAFDLVPNVAALLDVQALQQDISRHCLPKPDGGGDGKILTALLEGLRRHPLSPEVKREAAKWVERTVAAGVDAIVGGKQRGSYGTAALLVAVLVECRSVLDGPAAAAAVGSDFKGKYSRHSAFKLELEKALAKTRQAVAASAG